MMKNKKAMEYATDIVVGLVLIAIGIGILYISSSFVQKGIESSSTEVYHDLEIQTVTAKILEFPVIEEQRSIPLKYYIYEALSDNKKKQNVQDALNKIVAKRPDLTITIQYKHDEYIVAKGSLETKESYERETELPDIKGALSIQVKKYV